MEVLSDRPNVMAVFNAGFFSEIGPFLVFAGLTEDVSQEVTCYRVSKFMYLRLLGGAIRYKGCYSTATVATNNIWRGWKRLRFSLRFYVLSALFIGSVPDMRISRRFLPDD